MQSPRLPDSSAVYKRLAATPHQEAAAYDQAYRRAPSAPAQCAIAKAHDADMPRHMTKPAFFHCFHGLAAHAY